MPWPSHYKDRVSALQRVVKVFQTAIRELPAETRQPIAEVIGRALAEDAEAATEYAFAIGQAEEIQAALREAIDAEAAA